MSNKDIHISISGRQKDVRIGSSGREEKEVQVELTDKGTRNYEFLNNKPQINGITLSGNVSFSDLLPDGIIIDCGNSSDVPEEDEP